MPKSKKSKKTKTSKKTKKNITIKSTQEPKKDTVDVDDLFSTKDTSMDYDDVSKEGIIEHIKNKLLQNILNTRYNYTSWFNRYNRSYEFMDFLASYIKEFLILNNYTINEIYLFVRNNDIRRFSDFNDYYYLKNKLLSLREKLVFSLDRFVLKASPPSYYSDLREIFGPQKNIYLLTDPPKNKMDELQKQIDDLKNKTLYPAPVYAPTPTPAPAPAPAPAPGYKRPPQTPDERHQRAVELGIVDSNTGMPTPGNEDLYNEIMNGISGYKKNNINNKKNILASLDSIFD